MGPGTFYNSEMFTITKLDLIFDRNKNTGNKTSHLRDAIWALEF